MRILELKVEGYRSLRDVTWKPGNLNVLIGPNGGGKSNLIRALTMLSAAANGRLAKHVQSEGGMGPMLWDGKAECLSVALLMNDHDEDAVSPLLQYKLNLPRLGKTSQYEITEEILKRFHPPDQVTETGGLVLVHRKGQHLLIIRPDRGTTELNKSDWSVEETVLSWFSAPFLRKAQASRFQSELAGWCLYPDFQMGQDSPVRRGAVSRTERRLESDGSNLISVLHTHYEGDRGFKQNINDAMQAAFGPEFEELSFPPEADQRVQMRVRWKSLREPVSAADLSDGTLRFLRLLTILANPDPPSLIAIDEPETGLHPAMQKIVAEFAVEASRRSQVVLTTHSPEFLDAFDETLPIITVIESRNGETALKNLSGDALKQWLKSFTLGEILRTGEANVIEEEKP